MERVKQRILELLQTGTGPEIDPSTIRDKFSKLKSFLDRVNINTIKLFVKLTDTEEKPDSVVKKVDMNSFDNYLELSLPLYLVHFLKLCEEKSLTSVGGVSINCYDNLLKEDKYRKKRAAGQIVLMWREIGFNRYRLLSFVSTNFNEFDFDEKKFFIHEVGGLDQEANERSWKEFSELSILDLLEESKLISFSDAIKALKKL